MRRFEDVLPLAICAVVVIVGLIGIVILGTSHPAGAAQATTSQKIVSVVRTLAHANAALDEEWTAEVLGKNPGYTVQSFHCEATTTQDNYQYGCTFVLELAAGVH